MVAITERPRPSVVPELSPSEQARLERIHRYVEEHPKEFYTGVDVSLASERSRGFLSQSANGLRKVEDIARRHGINVGAGEPLQLPLRAFIGAAFALGPPNPRFQKLGRRHAEELHGKTVELPSSGVIMKAATREKKPSMSMVPFIPPKPTGAAASTVGGDGHQHSLAGTKINLLGERHGVTVENRSLNRKEVFIIVSAIRLAHIFEEESELKRKYGAVLTRIELDKIRPLIEKVPEGLDLGTILPSLLDKLQRFVANQDIFREKNSRNLWPILRFGPSLVTIIQYYEDKIKEACF